VPAPRVKTRFSENSDLARALARTRDSQVTPRSRGRGALSKECPARAGGAHFGSSVSRSETGGKKQISTVQPSSLDAGVNRVVWDMRYDRSAPADPAAIAQAINFVALAGPRANMGPPDRGPIVDPGEYIVEVSIGSSKSAKKFKVEEDPRVTWFSAADRAKRRQALNQLMDMTKEADTMRRKFAARRS
jgi:hypothetical protein